MATPKYGLPEISENQSAKYLTHNEALAMFEGILGPVISRSNGGPPSSPSDGDTYIVDDNSGDWSGASVNDVAVYYSGSWHFIVPVNGLTIWCNDESTLLKYDSSSSSWIVSYYPMDWANVISSNTTLYATNGYLADTSGSSLTLTLQSSPTIGGRVGVNDYYKNAGTNSIVIDPGDEVIEGDDSVYVESDGTYVIATDGATVEFIYSGATRGWVVSHLSYSDDNIYTDAEQSKLAGIESGADATDGQNVGTAIDNQSADSDPADDDQFAQTSPTGTLAYTLWSRLKKLVADYVKSNATGFGQLNFDQEYDNGTITSNTTIDWANGINQVVTVDADVTLSFTNIGVGTKKLRVVQGATGGVPTLPTGKWPGGEEGTFSTPSGAEDILSIYDNGTDYYYQLTKGWV